MGYYGLGPGTTVADRLSPLERALRRLPLALALEILEVLEKLTRNVVQSPGEPKFRQISLGNAKLKPLRGSPAAQEVMCEMGWERRGESTLVLPSTVRLEFHLTVVKMIEAKDHFRRELEKAKLEEKRKADPARAELFRQLDDDRRERDSTFTCPGGAPASAEPAPEPVLPADDRNLPPELSRAATVDVVAVAPGAIQKDPLQRPGVAAAVLRALAEASDDATCRAAVAALLAQPPGDGRLRDALSAALAAGEQAPPAQAATLQIVEVPPSLTPAAPAAPAVQAAPAATAAEVDFSARVSFVEALQLSAGAFEDAAGWGDVSAEMAKALAEGGFRQAYRLGRVILSAAADATASAEMLLVNNGRLSWPASTMLVCVLGDAMGCQHLSLGSLGPSEERRVTLEMVVPQRQGSNGERSGWAVLDVSTGLPLGPVLLLDVVRNTH